MTGYLSSYRVLDLSDDRGLLSGHMLAQLGAEVVHVEPPASSPARRVGPFAGDAPVGDKSLLWSAYAAGKRSLVSDTDTEQGRALQTRLIAAADFLIDTPDALAYQRAEPVDDDRPSQCGNPRHDDHVHDPAFCEELPKDVPLAFQ